MEIMWDRHFRAGLQLATFQSLVEPRTKPLDGGRSTTSAGRTITRNSTTTASALATGLPAASRPAPVRLATEAIRLLEALPIALPEFGLRLGVALAFWRSGNVKIDS